MNEREINYTDKATGETITGTVKQIAEKLGIHRNTLNNRLKEGSFDSPDCFIEYSNAQCQDSNAQPNEPNAQSEIQMHNSNAQSEEKKNQMHNEKKPNAQPKPAGKEDKQPESHNRLEKGKCIHCGKEIYHRLNGVYSCILGCSAGKAYEEFTYIPKKCAPGTDQLIVRNIEAINENLKGKIFRKKLL